MSFMNQIITSGKDKSPINFYIVATPPDTHLEVAKQVVDLSSEKPKILVEKPLCLPGEVGEFDRLDADIVVNYNHLHSPAFK